VTLRAAIVAKHARQSDERLHGDAAIVAESRDAARADDASPNDANAKARRGRKPKPMARTVESDRCYLMDRGYAKLLLWNVIHAAESS